MSKVFSPLIDSCPREFTVVSGCVDPRLLFAFRTIAVWPPMVLTWNDLTGFLQTDLRMLQWGRRIVTQ